MRPSFGLRLPTVRAKLTALVATTVVTMLATLPVLSWLLHKQLIDEVDNRVEEANKSFQQELKDDLDDLALAAKVLAADGDTRRFLVAKDAQRVAAQVQARDHAIDLHHVVGDQGEHGGGAGGRGGQGEPIIGRGCDPP